MVTHNPVAGPKRVHRMPAARRAVRNHGPYWITIAIPVLSSPLREELRGEFDERVWLCETRDLATIGQYYRHLPTVSDEETRASRPLCP